ncbi:MAG: MFS transporter [Candidatus Geothermarchaeales archaeon]
MEESLTEFLERAPLSRFHYVLLIIGSLIYCFTAMNVMLIAAALPAIKTEWMLDPITAGFLLSTGYVGMFIGALSCGVIADLIGRRKALLLTIFMMTIFTGLCSAAWDVLSMSIFRLLAGIGLGGSLPQPGVYVSEYIPAKHRGRFIGLVETSWVYGALLAILFPFFLIPSYGWRLTFLVALIPLFLVPLILRFIPESIRYLEFMGRREEATHILEKHGLIRTAPNGGKPGGRPPYSVKAALGLVWSPTYRGRTALLWILWAALVYTYHGIFLWLPTVYADLTLAKELLTPLYFTLIVTLLQVPGYFSATFLLDSVGRKPVLIAYLGLAGIGSYLIGRAVGITNVLIWSGVVSFFNLGAWAGLYTYTPELYPTHARGTGSGLAASIGRLAGILAPTLTGYLYATADLGPMFLVFALIHIAAALSVLILGIETKGKALEVISK